jgi:parallel beta-helix repeat protein
VALHNSVASKLLHVTSDHNGSPQDTSQIRDIWIQGDGNPTAPDGGCYLDHVVSQNPSQNGVVIENFHQLWGRFVSGDAALERPIWIRNCTEIHLEQCYASIGGKTGSVAGYSMVVDNTDLTKSFVTMVDCHAGGCLGTAGLYVKNVTHFSITNGVFLKNKGPQILLENCHHGSITGALIDCSENGPIYGIWLKNSMAITIGGCVLTTQVTGTTGIRIEGCNSVSIVGCDVKGLAGTNGWGILLYNSSFNAVSGNTVSPWLYGIQEVGTSNYNTITTNMCAYNASPDYGISTVGSNSIPAAGSQSLGQPAARARAALNIV